LRAQIRGKHYAVPVTVTDRIVARPDLVLLAVKLPDLSAACQQLLPQAAGVTVVTLQNGIHPDEIAASVLPPETAVGAIVMCAATALQPGHSRVHLTGHLVLGGPDPARVSAAASVLRCALPVRITRNLRGARWSKLIGNLGNGVSAATGLSWAQLARSAVGRAIAFRTVREGQHVARRAGVRLDYGVYLGGLPLAFKMVVGGGDFRGSTWQSVVRGRRSEVDDLNGEIVRTGRKLGLATPFNERIVAAVHQVEGTHNWCSVEDLWPAAA
jgi:2-dehydropantoate 2-reductase